MPGILREYKLIVVGDGGVGKSCLTTGMVNSNKEFNDEYDPTIEDSYRVKKSIDDGEVLLDVLDTAGQEEYWAMREQYMRTGEGFLLVYSITDAESFEACKNLRDMILRVKDKDRVPMIFVGNKCDLEGNRQDELQPDNVKSIVDSFGAKYIETSAKSAINVEECFFELVREIRKYDSEMSQSYSGKGANSNTKKHLSSDEKEVAADDAEDKAQAGCCCTIM